MGVLSYSNDKFQFDDLLLMLLCYSLYCMLSECSSFFVLKSIKV